MLDEVQKKLLEEKIEKDGESKVSTDLALGIYGNSRDPMYPKARLAELWLEKKREQRKNVGREEEITIAKEANDIARSAKNAAWSALFISAVSIIIAVLVAIFK